VDAEAETCACLGVGLREGDTLGLESTVTGNGELVAGLLKVRGGRRM
jgi:hypothetical protein